MKKLYFKYGVMGSSKSANALMTAFNYRQKGYNVLLLKSATDTREKSAVIKSRIGLNSPCELFYANVNLYQFVKSFEEIDIVIVDEAQFCTKMQIDELKQLTIENFTVLCYGLKTNFKGELFEGSKRLLELAESISEIKSVCRCGQKATMNARIKNGKVITSGEEIEIGGDDKYEAMCYECFLKYQKEPIKNLNK